MDKELLESIDRKMSVILSLLIEQREIASGELNREKLPKIEVVLKKTGFDAKSKQLEKLFREQSSIMAKDDQDNGNREISFEDVARLIVWAISRNEDNKSKLIKELHGFNFETGKIAKLLNMPSKSVSSVLTRKSSKKK